MANELTVVSGITKRESNGNYYYYLNDGAVIVSDTNRNQYFVRSWNTGDTKPVKFEDITDKLGANDIVEYLDNALQTGLYAPLNSKGIPVDTSVNAGFTRSFKFDTSTDQLDANTQDTNYVASVIKLIDQTEGSKKEFLIERLSMLGRSNDDFEFQLLKNVAITNEANLPDFVDYTEAGIAVSVNIGALDSTVTVAEAEITPENGYDSAYIRRNTGVQLSDFKAHTLEGTDYLVISFRPFTNGLDVEHAVRFSTR